MFHYQIDLQKCKAVDQKLNRKNLACIYVEIWVWIWSYLRFHRIVLESSDYQDSVARFGVTHFSTESSVKKMNFSEKIPLDEIKRIVTEKRQFGRRYETKFLAIFLEFVGLLRFWCKCWIPGLFIGRFCHYLRAFKWDVDGKIRGCCYGEMKYMKIEPFQN